MKLQELVNKLCNTLASTPGDTPVQLGVSGGGELSITIQDGIVILES